MFEYNLQIGELMEKAIAWIQKLPPAMQ